MRLTSETLVSTSCSCIFLEVKRVVLAPQAVRLDDGMVQPVQVASMMGSNSRHGPTARVYCFAIVLTI
jgi:hypothetical protein